MKKLYIKQGEMGSEFSKDEYLDDKFEMRQGCELEWTDTFYSVVSEYPFANALVVIPESEVNELKDLITKQRQAIEAALIYDPDVDHYKIKHTAYPKLKAALDLTKKLGL